MRNDFCRLNSKLKPPQPTLELSLVRLGNALFLHCRNCDSLAVVAVAHFDPHLAGHYLPAIRRADD